MIRGSRGVAGPGRVPGVDASLDALLRLGSAPRLGLDPLDARAATRTTRSRPRQRAFPTDATAVGKRATPDRDAAIVRVFARRKRTRVGREGGEASARSDARSSASVAREGEARESARARSWTCGGGPARARSATRLVR